MARARPSSTLDPLNRPVGEAPALQGLRAQKRQGLTVFQAAGEAGLQPLFWALMAAMYERVGQVTAGLSILDTALALAREPGSCNYEAELYRLKGELLLARAVEHHAEADACFRQALDVARRQ
jgi:tetratricopeptide (TPR) repeat protein